MINVFIWSGRSGNNWYKGKREVKLNIYVEGNCLEICDLYVTYKYLGKSLALSGEDSLQVIEMIQQCNLPLAINASAFHNLPLEKILHHFYNTKLCEE